MDTMILPDFWQIHPALKENAATKNIFNANDEVVKEECEKTETVRKNLQLEGLVGDLQCLLINTETTHLEKAVEEFLTFTGYSIAEAFEDEYEKTIVLKCDPSAHVLIKSRKKGTNPHLKYNLHPKTKELPNTRMESFVFHCSDIHTYYKIQKSRGVLFVKDAIVENDQYYYLQTIPSSFTGTSYGFIQWKTEKNTYLYKGCTPMEMPLPAPSHEYNTNIHVLDHAATRIKAQDRDAAIIELMEVTNYNFNFAIHVPSMNSITNVARLPGAQFSMVFTSGIEPFVNPDESGPTEKFVFNYGTRVHHLAFQTENIEYTFEKLKENGMKFLIELVGSEKEGLKQTFSYPSSNTFIVNEYIHRYGDFDGFFTRSNVEDLTKATNKQ